MRFRMIWKRITFCCYIQTTSDSLLRIISDRLICRHSMNMGCRLPMNRERRLCFLDWQQLQHRKMEEHSTILRLIWITAGWIWCTVCIRICRVCSIQRTSGQVFILHAKEALRCWRLLTDSVDSLYGQIRITVLQWRILSAMQIWKRHWKNTEMHSIWSIRTQVQINRMIWKQVVSSREAGWQDIPEAGECFPIHGHGTNSSQNSGKEPEVIITGRDFAENRKHCLECKWWAPIWAAVWSIPLSSRKSYMEQVTRTVRQIHMSWQNCSVTLSIIRHLPKRKLWKRPKQCSMEM